MLASIYFDNVFKKSLEQNWQYKDIKYRWSTLAQKEHTNTTVWRIDNIKKLLFEIEKDPGEVLSIILNIMQSIYKKYLDKANKVDKKRNEIHIHVLGLE